MWSLVTKSHSSLFVCSNKRAHGVVGGGVAHVEFLDCSKFKILVRSPWSDMKVSVRAGHILSPSLKPSAVGRAKE